MSEKIGVPYVGTYTYVCSKNNTGGRRKPNRNVVNLKMAKSPELLSTEIDTLQPGSQWVKKRPVKTS